MIKERVQNHQSELEPCHGFDGACSGPRITYAIKALFPGAGSRVSKRRRIAGITESRQCGPVDQIRGLVDDVVGVHDPVLEQDPEIPV